MPSSRSSRAQVVSAPPDVATAERLLAQADRHIASADVAGVDGESRYGMLYDGARKAADAVLRANGRRLTRGLGHHVAYLAEAQRLLGPEEAEILARLERARQIRNAVQYDTREVSAVEIVDLSEAAQSIVAAARAHVEGLE